MKTFIANTEEAPNKWWAIQDHRMKSIANASHYTAAQKLKGERMRMALCTVYSGKVYDVTFGKRSIAIKVDAECRVNNKKALKQLEAGWTQEGIFKKETPFGTHYHLPKV